MQMSREKATKDKFYTYVECMEIAKEGNGIPFSGPCWRAQKINSAQLLNKIKCKRMKQIAFTICDGNRTIETTKTIENWNKVSSEERIDLH